MMIGNINFIELKKPLNAAYIFYHCHLRNFFQKPFQLLRRIKTS